MIIFLSFCLAKKTKERPHIIVGRKNGTHRARKAGSLTKWYSDSTFLREDNDSKVKNITHPRGEVIFFAQILLSSA
jgi:hypothetical protein